MYKEPYTIKPSSLDFFGNRINGSGKWTLHKVIVPFDSVQFDQQVQLKYFNLYERVGKSVQTEADVLAKDATLVCPVEHIPVPYKKRVFDVPHPTPESVDAALVEEARKAIRISIFGNAEKKRQLYVIEHRGERLDAAEREWIKQKEKFDAEEDANEEKHNASERIKKEKADDKIGEYKTAHFLNDLFLNTTQEELEKMLKTLKTGFPSDMTLYYQVDLPHGLINISFEAPSERVIPLEKEVTHSRGTSMRPKNRTEINRDYLDCVCGLSYILAAQCFNMSGKVKEVFISAFVNRLDPQSATFEEDTLYSVVFDRDTFNWVIRPKSFLPYESFVFFPHAIELGHLLVMNPIDPLDLQAAGETLPGGNQFVESSRKDLRYDKDDSDYIVEEILGGSSIDLAALDDRFVEAARVIVINQRGSTADLQRKLGIGYAKAGRVMEQLECAGIVGPQVGARPREVLVKDLNELEETLNHLMGRA